MTRWEPLFGCPFGGCGPYGWCPCAVPDEPDPVPEPEEDELHDLEPGTELMYVRGRLRAVETLPPL
ncbi:hypothetical protein ACWGI0_23035 [Streptomyces sp. NPDC054802]